MNSKLGRAPAYFTVLTACLSLSFDATAQVCDQGNTEDELDFFGHAGEVACDKAWGETIQLHLENHKIWPAGHWYVGADDDLCNPERELSRHWISGAMLLYGIKSIPEPRQGEILPEGRPFHDPEDYYRLTIGRKGNPKWHAPHQTRLIEELQCGSGSAVACYRRTPTSANKIDLSCRAFSRSVSAGQGSGSGVGRAGTMVHEAGHGHLQFLDTTHKHFECFDGAVDCDAYLYYPRSEPKGFLRTHPHTAYQLQYQALCDLQNYPGELTSFSMKYHSELSNLWIKTLHFKPESPVVDCVPPSPLDAPPSGQATDDDQTGEGCLPENCLWGTCTETGHCERIVR